MATIKDILDCLSEPEIKQFPDFTAAIHDLVKEREELINSLRTVAECGTCSSSRWVARAAIAKAEGATS